MLICYDVVTYTKSKFIGTYEYDLWGRPVSVKEASAGIDTDRSGAIIETVFDVITLAISIVDVCQNPIDPWAWAGLVGDVIDLIPCVTQIGEAVKGVRLAKLATKAYDVGDGLKLLKVFDLADNYKLGDDTFNNHILDRHGPTSTYGNKSHFNAGSDIKEGIDST